MAAARGGYTRSLAGPGLFVSFEGIDGCGKTTQITLFLARLREMGIEPVRAQEPGGTPVGSLIRGVLLDSANANMDPRTELLLYFASRAQNVAEVIRPAVEAGKLVVSDRFTDSTVAYQGHGRHLGEDIVFRLEEIACDGIRPDLTFWLDLDPVKARSRVRSRTDRMEVGQDRMEVQPLEFFERVRRGYDSIHKAEPSRVRRIDAEGPPEAIAESILRLVLPRISHLRKDLV